MYAVSLWLFTLGRRMRVSGAERVLAEDSREAIVYLRPFGTDRAEIARRLSPAMMQALTIVPAALGGDAAAIGAAKLAASALQ